MIGGLAGLEAYGSIAVTLWAAARGHFDRAQAETALERLAQTSLWISGTVLAKARTLLDEIFGRRRVPQGSFLEVSCEQISGLC